MLFSFPEEAVKTFKSFDWKILYECRYLNKITINWKSIKEIYNINNEWLSNSHKYYLSWTVISLEITHVVWKVKTLYFHDYILLLDSLKRSSTVDLVTGAGSGGGGAQGENVI